MFGDRPARQPRRRHRPLRAYAWLARPIYLRPPRPETLSQPSRRYPDERGPEVKATHLPHLRKKERKQRHRFSRYDRRYSPERLRTLPGEYALRQAPEAASTSATLAGRSGPERLALPGEYLRVAMRLSPRSRQHAAACRMPCWKVAESRKSQLINDFRKFIEFPSGCPQLRLKSRSLYYHLIPVNRPSLHGGTEG